MTKKAKRRIEVRVQTDMAQMEAKLQNTSPGVLDLLRVYGGYENALHHMDSYLGIIHPEPRFNTTDGTA
jgi:hypothetical protein